MKVTYKRLSGIVLFLASIVQISVCHAQGEVLTSTGIKKVITVAQDNGDFVNPSAAINSISHTDENNQFLILVKPGEYYIAETLELKPYVDLVGSGRSNTTITMAIRTSSSTAVFVRSQNTPNLRFPSSLSESLNRIANITIKNSSRGQRTQGISTENAIVEIENVSVVATGGESFNFGISISPHSQVDILNSEITASSFGYFDTPFVAGIGIFGLNGGRVKIDESYIIASARHGSANTEPGNPGAYGIANIDINQQLLINDSDIRGSSAAVLLPDTGDNIELNKSRISSEIALYPFPASGGGPTSLSCYRSQSFSGSRIALTSDCQIP